MKLVAITVKNYRSITRAYKLHLGASTVLIGRNNEGKSNVLRALAAGLSFLRRGHRIQGAGPSGRALFFVSPYERQRLYAWENDYPIALQETQPAGGSEITLEFDLDKTETKALRAKIGSTLNQNLPIRVMFGREDSVVSIAKQGPGAKGLTSKVADIAQFIANRLDFQYIPAVRTAESAQEVVDDMVALALKPLESDPNYRAAIKTIADLQRPVLDNISRSIKGTLVQFLPAIKSVKVQIPGAERVRALRRSSEIVIDDGSATPLKHKGDGVQSLAAIALMRRAAVQQSGAKYSVIALEEPESHLHPQAIHELRRVLQELARTQQIVITTHCPLFVDRVHIGANIIVDRNKARSAESVEEIRDILGVRAADNLRHAELVLIVEGSEDVVALNGLLPAYSPTLAEALQNGTLVLNALDGATNLSYKASLLRAALCEYHCYLDNDDAGQKSLDAARRDGLLSEAEYNLTICNGMNQAEIEDIYETEAYRVPLEGTYTINLNVPAFHANKKWSDRLRDTFLGQGKQWNDHMKGDIKALVARAVAVAPGAALNAHKRSSFDGLVAALDRRLAELHR